MISKDKHIKFYQQQIKAHEDKWLKYANSHMSLLVNDKKLFIGRIWSLQEHTGNLIIRFKASHLPRINFHYFLGVKGKDLNGTPNNWNFSYATFRKSSNPAYYSGLGVEIKTVSFWKTEGDWSFVIIGGVDEKFANKINEYYLLKGKQPYVIVAEKDPPIDYLKSLIAFIRSCDNTCFDKYIPKLKEENWKPQNLDNSQSLKAFFINRIESSSNTIVQGPPGTGKSYLAAEICEAYLSNEKTICVSALTNKALTELVSQPPLKQKLLDGIIYKTSLTSKEKKDFKGLNNAKDIFPHQGELLLATYYSLSKLALNWIHEARRFDLLIIEEGSQAFLATIELFSSIAKKVLVIGDHKQLLPIVLQPETAKDIHSNILDVVNGFETHAYNNNDNSYRLTKTRRLSKVNANLTKCFYNDQLASINNETEDVDINLKTPFVESGGVSIVKLNSAMNEYTEQELFNIISNIAGEILAVNKLKSANKLKVAILTPYIDCEKKMYQSFNRNQRGMTNVEISTVHRIQGLTTNYTILYLPLNNMSQMDLNENFFNVATSRAKNGTLIITYKHIDLASSASLKVKNFIAGCKDVTAEFNKKYL